MSDDDDNGISVNINVEHTDRSVADIIRALLYAPAAEAGSLLADGIGIFGDRIRQKRMKNLQLGLEKVGSNLSELGVEMKDITPPDEEDLHLLVEGISLSGDEDLRDLWVGLFAQALDPNSTITANRSYMTILRSLSSFDVKIISFLAFVISVEAELADTVITFKPKDFQNITDAEKKKIEEITGSNQALRGEANQKIKDKAEVDGLANPPDSSWSLNLVRLGIIERPPVRLSGFNEISRRMSSQEDLMEAIGKLRDKIKETEEVEKHRAVAPENLFQFYGYTGAIHLELNLSAFGNKFAKACGLIEFEE